MRKNMKKFTRTISFVMASMLCLSACGEKQADVSTDTKGSQVESSASNSTESQGNVELSYWELLDNVSDTSELPDWEGDTLEINIWYAGSTTHSDFSDPVYDPETDLAFKELERVTGVKFNFEESYDNGGNNIDAKLPMVVASNDLPTMIVGYDINKQLRELYDNGYLADLTDYYNNGDLNQVLNWLPLEEADLVVYSNVKSEDGDYYGIPNSVSSKILTSVWNQIGYEGHEVFDMNYYSMYGSTPSTATGIAGTNALMVRNDILKALRPDALTYDELAQIYVEKGSFTEEEIFQVSLNSPEEFYDFLRDIKDLLANGNYVGLDGKPMEVTYGPHTETDNYYMLCWLPKLFAGVNAEYFSFVDLTADDSEIMQMAYDSEWWIDYMKDINMLVREDVIAQNSFIDNLANYQEKLKNLHYAVTYAESMPLIVSEVGSEIGYTPIWVNTPYNTEIGGLSAVQYTSYYGIFKDTLTDDQLDQLIHAINYINSVVGTNNFIWGPESAGLFTEDAQGNRTFVDEEMYNCAMKKEDNGAARKYGFVLEGVKQNGFQAGPRSIGASLLQPAYLAASENPRLASNLMKYYTPGILPGQSNVENAIVVNIAPTIYSSISNEIQGLKDFWAARNGYESQVKKVLVASSDADFEEQLENLRVFSRENGITDEVMKEFNAKFVEYNKVPLQVAGVID